MSRTLALARRHALGLTGFALAIAVMGPLLRPGFTLLYDMVFVPHLRFSADLVGISRTYPRSVPTDLWVALGSVPFGGQLVQKAALVFIMAGAAVGAGRLLPSTHPAGRIAAGVLYAWNPFVYERLLLGQWALMLGTALLPWAVAAALRFRRREPGSVPRLLLWLGALTAASPYAGIIGGLTTLAVALWPPLDPLPDMLDRRRDPWRDAALLFGASVAISLPWLIPTLLHPHVPQDPALALRLFQVRSDSPLGTVGSLVSLGGMWRTDLAPPGRAEGLWIPAFALIVAVAAWGWPALRHHWPRGARLGLGFSVLLGLIVALAPSTPGARDVVAWLARVLPGGGFLRDGQKFVMPLDLAEAVLFGFGVARLIERRSTWDRVTRALTFALPVLPLALAPTLAWAAGGRLGTADYPASWARVQRSLSASEAPGAVLVLPWHAYLPFDWNGDRPVHQPAPEYLSRDVVAPTALEVDGSVLPAEDPWSRQAGAALSSTGPLGPKLAALGVRFVLLFKEADWRTSLPRLAGLEVVVDAPDLTLYRGPPAGPAPTYPVAPWGPVAAGYVIALAVLAWAALSSVRDTWAGRPRRDRTSDTTGSAGDAGDGSTGGTV